MAVHRERVDPQDDSEDVGLVHRRWLLPDDPTRPIGGQQLSRLWRGLLELSVLDENDDVIFAKLALPLPDEEAAPEQRDIPAAASAGLLLANAKAATLVTQVVQLDAGHRDPYRSRGEQNGEQLEGDWRDYTLYAVDDPGTWLVPIGLEGIVCGNCGNPASLELPWFGEAQLLEVDLFSCPECDARLDPARDKAELRSGAVFLLEEVCCKAALSVEMPFEPHDEELPDAAVAGVLRDAFGGVDELAHDGVEPA